MSGIRSGILWPNLPEIFNPKQGQGIVKLQSGVSQEKELNQCK